MCSTVSLPRRDAVKNPAFSAKYFKRDNALTLVTLSPVVVESLRNLPMLTEPASHLSKQEIPLKLPKFLKQVSKLLHKDIIAFINVLVFLEI